MSASLAALLSRPQAGKAAPSARLPLRRASHLLALEQRFMFDGAAVADAAHAAGDAAVLAQIAAVPAAVEVRAADPALDNGKKEAVLVDTSVADYKTLEAGIAAGMAIIEFDGSKDGLAQIANWAAGQSGYDAIHILSHGSEATLNLGTTVLTDSRLNDSLMQAELAELGHALKAGGDLLLYGCDLAANSDGAQFLSDLAAATGADVAASTDVTGATAKGGDWTLEAATGAIEATSISAERMADFGDVLALVNLDGPVTSGNKTWNGSSGADTFKLNSSESYAGGTSDGSKLDQVGNFITNFQVATDVIDFSAVVSDFTTSSIVLSKVASFRDPAVNEIVVTAAKSDGTLASTATASGTTGTMVTVSGNGAWYIFFLSGVNYTDLTLSNFFFVGPTTTVTGASLSADTGSSSSDFITNTANQTISGTLSTNLAAGEKVEVSYDGGSTWSDATTYSVGSSSWSTTTTLSGSNTFMARVTDTNGSSIAYNHSYTLDNTAPAAPSAPDLTSGTDSGTSNTDNITSNTTPTFTGADTANSTITLYDTDGTTVLGTTTADGSGNWTITPSSALTEGSHTLTVKATDLAGNTSTASASLAVTIDTTAPTVSNVTASTANGSYKVGDTISIQVAFSETVNVTGTPQLTLETGSTDRIANYASGSGSNTLTFTYTVQAGDTSADLDYLSTTALALNSGTIKDTAGNNATLTLAAPAAAGSLGANKAIVVDGVVPTVSNVTASTANGSYKVGDTISIQVAFSETVNVTGTPQLTLETGSTDRIANYASGSGSNTLTFTYTVQAGDTSADLDYLSTTALALNSGTIKDTAGNNATLTLAAPAAAGSLGANKAIVVDGVVPTVSNVTASTADGSYKVGDTISIQVAFSETVNVTGTPQLTLETGSTDRIANYASGSGSNTLTFTYTVQAGDTSADLDYLSTTALALNSGTIKDTAGNNATLTLAAPAAAGSLGANKAIVVDTTAPNAPSTPDLDSGSDSGSSSTDNITSATTPTFSGTAEAGSTVKLYDTDGTTLLGTATATGGNWSITSSTLSAGSHTVTAKATDAAGNTSAASTGLTITIDNTAPTTPTVNSLSTANLTPTLTGTATLGAGETLTVTVGGATYNVTPSGGNWSLDLSSATPASGTLSLSAGNTYSVTATANDTAGNSVSDGSSNELSVLTGPPPTTTGSTITLSVDTGTSNTDLITNTASQTISGTLTAATITGETVEVSVDGGNNWSTATNTVGSSSFSISATLSAGTHALQVRVANANGGGTPYSQNYTLDTTAPTTSIASAAFSADTGSSSDFITSTAAQTISGTLSANLANGEIVQVSLNNGATWTTAATTVGQNTWSLSGQTLSGSNTLKVRVWDTAGNSGTTFSQAYTLDTSAPSAPPTPDMATASDSGSSSTDDITSNTTPTFTGTGENGATVTLFKDANSNGVVDSGESLGSATVSGGAWSIASSALAAGTYTVKAIQTDVAGNTSAASSGLSVTIDTAAPNAPSTPDLAAASDSGNSSTDNKTNATTPTITGTAEANSTVKLYDTDGTTLLGTGSADGSGTWSITASTLSEGNHTLTAKATDAAGNTSAASSGLTITIDTTAPTVTSVSVPSNAAYRAGQNLDFTVNFNEAVQVNTTGGTPRIAMVVGSTTVYADYLSGSGTSALVFRYTVQSGLNDADGITVGALSLNGGTLNDVAGNNASTTLNSVGSTSSVLVDTTAPTNTIATAVLSADTGLDTTDMTTQTASQTISGTLASNLASGEVVKVSLDNGATWATATTTVGQNTWSLSGQTLIGSNTLKVKVSDAAGNDGTEYTHGYAFDNMEPTIASATVNGNTVVLTYNEALASGVTPQTGEYVVKVGGVAVTVNAVAYNAVAKTVTLTLATAVTSTDTVTVSYTKDGTPAHEVQDVAGNRAANLSDRAVTNNTASAQTQVPPPVPVVDPAPPAPPTPVTPPAPPQTPVIVATPSSFNSAIVLSNNPVGDASLTGIVNVGTGGDMGKGGSDLGATPTLTRSTNNGFPVAVKSGGFSSDGLLVNRPITDQTLTTGGRTEVTVPADTFSHSNPNAVVTLTAKLANGAALPAWVSFDAQKGKFVMQPPPGVRGDIAIRLVARDTTGREVVTVFTVHVNQRAAERGAQLLPGRPGLSEQLQIAAAQGDSLAALRLALGDQAATVRG